MNQPWRRDSDETASGKPGAVQTVWEPRSKPIWFTELGCPAVDKGPNQPNVFPDPKSSESASPYFSNGGRSDIAQRNFIEAHQRYWDPAVEGFEDSHNPLAPGGWRMLDHTRSLLWAWDARPFPAFPLREDEWRDGGNWHLGHWLNGRLDASSCSDLINSILADHGVAVANTIHAEGTVQGYVLLDPSTARAALEPLVELFGIVASDEPDQLVFRLEGAGSSAAMVINDVALSHEPVFEIVRKPDHELPREAVLNLRELFLEFQTTTPRSRRLGVVGNRQQAINFPGTVEFGQAQSLLDDWMQRQWTGREQVTFSLAPADIHVEPGDFVRLPSAGLVSDLLVTKVEQGLSRNVTAKQISRVAPTPWRGLGFAAVTPVLPILAGKPDAHLLDLPMNGEDATPESRFCVAVWQKPWQSQSIYAAAGSSGFTLRGLATLPAVIGRLTAPLSAQAFEGRIDRANSIFVKLSSGELASVGRLELLNGANTVAIKSSAGDWELIQFESAEEIDADTWQLSTLLRGQLGTIDAALAGADAGAVFILIDQAVTPAGLSAMEVGLERNWRIGPSGFEITEANFVEATITGGVRSRLPLSPVHLQASRNGSGDLLITWVRRTRIGGDDWQQSEVPLGEEIEEYQVEIAPAGGTAIRTATTATASWIYGAAEIAADFTMLPVEIDITIRQRSIAAGWGIPASRRFTLF